MRGPVDLRELLGLSNTAHYDSNHTPSVGWIPSSLQFGVEVRLPLKFCFEVAEFPEEWVLSEISKLACSF